MWWLLLLLSLLLHAGPDTTLSSVPTWAPTYNMSESVRGPTAPHPTLVALPPLITTSTRRRS